jgi:hypothetical protein
LKNGKFNSESWHKFRIYTERLDKLRGESLETVDPEIFRFMTMSHDELVSFERGWGFQTNGNSFGAKDADLG